MSGLKTIGGLPGFNTGQKVSPDEIDTTKQYIVVFPQVGTASVGTAVVGGTSATGAFAIFSKSADYPRNLEFNLVGTHGTLGGSVIMNGKDQFGQSITETIQVPVGTLGGTVAGTKVFAQVTSGTVYHGTHPGPGTPSIGWGTTGTTALFGLPDKIRGTQDVIAIAYTVGQVGSAVGGGTIGAFVNAGVHAVAASTNVTGSCVLSVLYRPSYDSSGESNNSTLTPVA